MRTGPNQFDAHAQGQNESQYNSCEEHSKWCSPGGLADSKGWRAGWPHLLWEPAGLHQWSPSSCQPHPVSSKAQCQVLRQTQIPQAIGAAIYCGAESLMFKLQEDASVSTSSCQPDAMSSQVWYSNLKQTNWAVAVTWHEGHPCCKEDAVGDRSLHCHYKLFLIEGHSR